MYCRNCGTELKEGSAFCGKCGYKVVVPRSIKKAEKKRVKKENREREINNKEAHEIKKKIRNKKIVIATITSLVLIIFLLIGFIIVKPIYLNSPVRKVYLYIQDGEAYLSDENYEKAEKKFEAVLELRPDNERAISGLSVIYEEKVKEYEAICDYKNAILYAEMGYELTEDIDFKSEAERISSGEIYDKDDNLIKKIVFDEEYSVISYTEMKYNREDQLILESVYDVDGVLSRTVEYLETENLIQTTYYKNEKKDYVYKENYFEERIGEEYYSNDGVLNCKFDYGQYNDETLTYYYVLNGKDTSLVYTGYGKDNKYGEYCDDGTYCIRCYNEDLVQIAAYYCDVNRKLISYEIHDVNDMGQVLSITKYTIDGKRLDSYGFEYIDDSHRWSKQTHYFEDGSIDYYIEYTYDDEGNEVDEDYFNADGSKMF